ncbi:MAG: M28 family peptidase [Bacteroides sp.]|nr:M28 family peptidase [Bacteroides sp.]
MKHIYTFSPLLLLLAFAVVACSSNKKATVMESDATDVKRIVNVPQFDADSAYSYVKAQVDFGPRVPNSPAHKACGDYLAQALERFGAKVYNQYADLVAYDGKTLKARNIIGAFKPEAKKRIVIFSHWDSRPWADQDPDKKNRYTPILGANDGASGVGVMLEIARNLQQQPAELGVDLIFLDAEDYGAHSEYKGAHKEEFWCLGSQYWGRHPHVQGYNARFGILLDMVGGKDAVYRYEYFSEQYAHSVNRKVWKAADRLGYGQYFVKEEGNAATDDHLFVNRYARIPTIDIIPYSETHDFFEYWHTVKDDMDAIDRNTMKAVGQTVMEVIYTEH